METMQTIGTILFGLSGLGFLLLAVFDKPFGSRQQARASLETESGSAILLAVSLLRAILARLNLAAAGNNRPGRTGGGKAYSGGRVPQDLEKVA